MLYQPRVRSTLNLVIATLLTKRLRDNIMFTLTLAWINAKYKCKYELLFVVMIIFDWVLTMLILTILE